MFRCLNCGELFEEPAEWGESEEFWGSECMREESGCPNCKGDYEEVFECAVCGEYCFYDEHFDGFYHTCENCEREALKTISIEEVKDLMKEQNDLSTFFEWYIGKDRCEEILMEHCKNSNPMSLMEQDLSGWYHDFKEKGKF